MSNWQRLDTKIVYQNPYMKVHEDNVVTPAGRTATYGWVETVPAVVIVGIDDHGKVVLVKQLRYTTGQPSWELPGGGVEGEDVQEAAKREFAEEAGLHADKWVSLAGEFFAWKGYATQRNSVHIAHDLHKVKRTADETDDFIEAVQSFTWAELKTMIKSGELNDGASISAIMLAGLHLGHLK